MTGVAVRRFSLAGSVPVIVCAATAIMSFAITGSDAGPQPSPRRLFVSTWLVLATGLGAVALVSGSAVQRSVAGTVAAAAMLVAGAAGLMTIGLPLAMAGVVEVLYVLSSVEAAAAGRRWVWLGLALAALGVVVAFAVGGLALSP